MTDQHDTDILVIGGGLIGSASAWHLARAGIATILVTAGPINNAASSQNAGSLHFQLERRFLENGEALADQAAATLSLNQLAIREWQGLEAALRMDLGIALSGGLMVAESAQDMAILECKVRREQRAGLATELLDRARVRVLAPYLSERICAASYLATEGQADPKRVTPAFAKGAVEGGTVLLENVRVTRLAKQGSVFEAGGTAQGHPLRIRARKVLIAAGIWTVELAALLNCHIPAYPVALTMSVTERTPPILPHLIQHVGKRLSLKQARSGNILIGGGWPSKFHQKAQGGFDLDRRPQLLHSSLRNNLQVACDTVPSIAAFNLIRSWTGATTVTADQLPIVGEVRHLPGLYVATGGSAFTLGPTIARLLVRAMLGDKAEPELALFSPNRFGHLNSFMG